MKAFLKHSKRSIFVVILLPLWSCTGDPAPPAEYQPRENFLAKGDPVAGRQLFIDKKCVACHEVAGDDFDTRPPNGAGPQLGTMQAEQSLHDVAGSIVLPSHRISKAAGPWKTGGETFMEDYSALTVRELVDLIAYIRTPARGKASSPSDSDP
jgi:mono/diheme cytochrome c family protein